MFAEGRQVSEVDFTDASSWLVRRFAKIKEVVFAGGRVRYKVIVWDEGREPFLTQWFNDPVPASDFIDKLKSQGVRIRG